MNILKEFYKWIEDKHRQVQFALTIVTLFLTIATFLMAGFMFWQARILKNSVIAQRDSVTAQNESVKAQRDSINAQNESIKAQRDSVNAQMESVKAQKDSIDVQIKELSLGKRPYVYVEIENVSIKPRIGINATTSEISIDYMVTADVKFKNEGIIPAVVTKVSYFVTTSVDKRHLDTPKYFVDNLGSYPYPTIIFPKQENIKFGYGADCSSSAERIYFNVVISYEGYKDKNDTTAKTYWYSFISKYASIRTPVLQKIPLPDGKEQQVSIMTFQMVKLEMKGEWDRNTDFDVPKVYEPDWKTEEEQLAKQRKFLK